MEECVESVERIVIAYYFDVYDRVVACTMHDGWI